MSPSKRRPTLAGRLLLRINLALVLALGLFMLWDYRVEWRNHLREKRTAMQKGAKTLLPAIQRARPSGAPAVQILMDEVCGAMQEAASPGHHIAVRMGSEVLQARAHHRQSERMYEAMRSALSSRDGLADTDKGWIVVGMASEGHTSLFVSEYVPNIKRALRAQTARRLLSILALGVVLGAVVNLLAKRMVAEPLGAMVSHSPNSPHTTRSGRFSTMPVGVTTRGWGSGSVLLSALLPCFRSSTAQLCSPTPHAMSPCCCEWLTGEVGYGARTLRSPPVAPDLPDQAPGVLTCPAQHGGCSAPPA